MIKFIAAIAADTLTVNAAILDYTADRLSAYVRNR